MEGTLACRFKSREQPYLYANVPENAYQILLRSPYAGSYFRKQIRDKYPLIGEKLPAPYQPREKPTPKDLQPIVEIVRETNLWGEVIRSHSRKPSRNS